MILLAFSIRFFFAFFKIIHTFAVTNQIFLPVKVV
jgi:hypothetical protein